MDKSRKKEIGARFDVDLFHLSNGNNIRRERINEHSMTL